MAERESSTRSGKPTVKPRTSNVDSKCVLHRPPLGWSLSAAYQHRIKLFLQTECHRAQALLRLIEPTFDIRHGREPIKLMLLKRQQHFFGDLSELRQLINALTFLLSNGFWNRPVNPYFLTNAVRLNCCTGGAFAGTAARATRWGASQRPLRWPQSPHCHQDQMQQLPLWMPRCALAVSGRCLLCWLNGDHWLSLIFRSRLLIQ